MTEKKYRFSLLITNLIAISLSYIFTEEINTMTKPTHTRKYSIWTFWFQVRAQDNHHRELGSRQAGKHGTETVFGSSHLEMLRGCRERLGLV